MSRAYASVFVIFLLLPTLCHSLASPTISSSPQAQNILNPKVAIRKIKSQPANVTHALQVLEKNGDQPIVVVEALRVCRNCQQYDLALDVLEKYPSEPARTMTISVLGSSEHHYQKALQLLDDKDVTSASYNAAIAACARAKDWQRALHIHNNQMPKEQRTTLTTNALMTILAQCRRGAEALQVLQDFDDDTNNAEEFYHRPTRVTYQTAIHAMVRSQMEMEAFTVLERLVKETDGEDNDDESSVTPTGAMFDMVVAAFQRRSNWEYIRKVEQLRHPTRSIELSDVQNKYSFRQWDTLERVGIGKKSYFVLGRVWIPQSSGSPPLNITIGVQPHRNPGKNGIQLEFHENHSSSDERTKLGFLLMQNSAIDNTSTLLGMFLTPASRGTGISKACMAVWLALSMQANIRPKTGIINKPLLALALQHTFGFRPEKGGIDIELVSPSAVKETAEENEPKSNVPPLWIYSPSGKSIAGAFSPWDIQTQNIRILSKAPSPEARRLVSVRTAFETPSDLEQLQDTIHKILPEGSIVTHLDAQDLRRVYLGKE